MIRKALVWDLWDVKTLRIIGIIDGNNVFPFKIINFFLELLFLPDLWFIIGFSKYYVCDIGRDIIGCLGVMGKNHVYDCVVNRNFRGGNIMKNLINVSIKDILDKGFVPKLDCIPELEGYYENHGFVAYKKSKGNIKMRYKKDYD